MADDFGGKPWQGRPKGSYWLPKEFHVWPEVRSLGLVEIGVFFDVGIFAARYPGRPFSRQTAGYQSARCRFGDLVDRGLWRPAGKKTFATKTIAEMRLGRGTRGPILRFSELLFCSVASCAAGPAALGVYALAASWSLTTDRPGYVPTEAALRFGKPKHVSALWDSGLWLVREHGFCMSKGDHPLQARWMLARDDERAAIPDDVRQRVMERCDNRCVRCGATDGLALDHIYPWSLGGPDDEDNLQVLCTPCNSAKGAKVLEKGATW